LATVILTTSIIALTLSFRNPKPGQTDMKMMRERMMIGYMD